MFQKLMGLSRPKKRAILFAADFVLVQIALLLAFSLRYGMLNPYSVAIKAYDIWLVIAVASIVVISGFSLHKIKLRDIDLKTIQHIGLASITLLLITITSSYILQANTPRSVPLIFGVSFFVLAVGFRLVALAMLTSMKERQAGRVPVAIYGAGSAGVQIAAALRNSGPFRPAVFLDDSPTLQGLRIGGLTVYPPAALKELIAKKRAQRVILAMPSLSNVRRDEILRQLRSLDCEVQMLPSYAELLQSDSLVDNLQTVRPDELLGRDKVDLDGPEVTKAYAGRSVMVTGAGGSIGSELCRQLTDCKPRRIVLYEHSEYALYQIERELRATLSGAHNVEICTRLGSVTDDTRVRHVIRNDEVEFILHAAAYKHVPIVEDNEIEGARNNVLGTKVIATAACELGVERFILVSTDKAVRPTNVMGATKRLAELVIQDLQKRHPATKLAMVRFGNVLGSSGSVFPLFRQQIEAGGPVTVTHPEVTRYFMTIPEAARLVLLAGAFAKGADVFVLDMGQPRKIIEIARRMIELSGQKVKDADNTTGIEIKVTGLRPGEKLYEELLIDSDNLRATPHEKIMRAEEHELSELEVASMIKKLRQAIDTYDNQVIREIATEYVNGYTRLDPNMIA